MANPSDRLTAAFKQLMGHYEPASSVYLARYIEESSTAGYHIVDVLAPSGEVLQRRPVLGNVAAWPGVIVRVGVDRLRFGGEEWAILGADTQSYVVGGGGTAPPTVLGPHAPSHHWQGIDELYNLDPLQFYPVRCQADSGMVVKILAGKYFAENSYRRLSADLSVDLTANIPGGNRRYVMISLDAAGAATVTNGAILATLAATDIPLAPEDEHPIAAVWLVNGDTDVDRGRIDDVRFLDRVSGLGVRTDLILAVQVFS